MGKKEMRNRTVVSLIAAGVVVLILSGALLLALSLTEEPAATAPAETPTEQGESVPVAFVLEQVTSVAFAPKDETAYIVALTHGGDGTFTSSLSPRRTGFSYDQAIMTEQITAAVLLSGCRYLTGGVGAAELESYGFDEPLITWTVTQTDGHTATLELGRQTGGGDGLYLREAGGGDIYILPLEGAAAIARAERELRSLALFPDYESEQQAVESLSYFSVAGYNTPFEIRLLQGEETENSVSASYQFVTPTTWYCDNYGVSVELLPSVLSMGFTAVIEDDPADLTLYGLDEPYTLTVADVNGWRATFYVGTTDENGGRYVMREGIPTVYVDLQGDYSFLDINYASLLNKLFWVYDIKNVAQVDYQLGEVRHSLRYDVTENGFAGTYDGGAIGEENGRRLYIQTISTRLYDILADDAVVSAERYGAITVTLRDGEEHRMELFAVGDRLYNVRFDGEDLRLTVHKSSVETLLTMFDTIESGGTIPMI